MFPFPKSNKKNTSQRSFRKFAKQNVIIFIFISILATSVPAAPEVIVGSAKEGYRSLRFSFLSSSPLSFLLTTLTGKRKGKSPSMNASAISIMPGDMTIHFRAEAVLAAVAYDEYGSPINGLDYSWEYVDVTRELPARPFNGGIFKGHRSGTFRIKATYNGLSDEVDVTVLPAISEESLKAGARPRPPKTVSSRGDGEPKNTKKKVNNPETQTESLLPEATWDDDNYESALRPGNMPGTPPGAPMDGGAGNGNFQLSAPVVSLPGRGIDLALNLHYNSRLWNKNNNQYTFDVDQTWPAPGWSLGFGRIVYMGEDGGCMLVDADGTRRGYSGSISYFYNGMTFKGHTTDGSFIDYGCTFNYTNWGTGWAVMPNGTRITYSTISATPALVLPTSITDAQGNYISITYNNHASHPQLNTITDTLGRIITFHYDTNGRLIEIRAPKMPGSENETRNPRTVLRLHYKPFTLNYSFAYGSTTVVRQGTVHVLDAIYYPGTKTGYWFGDEDSYSSYGMLAKVVEQRGMDWEEGLEEQGDVIAGTMTKQALYNYPLGITNETGRTNGASLTDAPTYTKLTESWAGRDVEQDAVTTYSFDDNTTKHDGTSNSPARSVTITQPTGVINRQYSYRTPGAWTDGLVFTDETFVMDGMTEVLIGKSLVSWGQGNSSGNLNFDAPRPTWAKVFDENGDSVKTEYTYGTNKFNQITQSCDYDDADALLRCTEADYENSSDYIGGFDGSGYYTFGRHIFNLVTSTRIKNSSNVVVSRTDYEYDNYSINALTNASGVIQHKHESNPYTTELQNGACLLWNPSFSVPSCSYEGEEVWIPTAGGYTGSCQCEDYDQVTVYDETTEKRGNITKITTYGDAATPSGAIYETRAYDMTGNVLKSSSACCQEISNTYTIDTMYAYPESQTRGASDPMSAHRVTTSNTYAYETGLVLSSTDPNGLTSTTEYDIYTLRPTRSISSTGAYTVLSYNDTAMTVTEEVFDDNDGLAGKTVKYLNGVGQLRKEESYNPDSIVDIVEKKYTEFGEEWKTSNPYRTGQTVYWTENIYDPQRRLTKVIEPDGSFTEAFYNESVLPSSVSAAPGNTTRIVDAWGRERWGRYDQQGRLVQVVEPNPDKTANPGGKIISSGVAVSGSLLTTYTYDTLGRLTQTDQGSQVRKFSYDSLGRLTRQKLAEQTATLDASGTFVGGGHVNAIWAEAFVYDNRSNLVQKTDARGVKTNYSFELGGGGLDPLNRIQSRSYDLTGPLESGITIHSAPEVTYEYMTTGDKTRIKKIRTAGLLTEDYTYDGQSRVSEYKQAIDARTNYPMTTSYLYDTLDRITEVHYPAQYGLTGNPRKIVAHSYDSASRLTGMTYNGDAQASEISYNAAGQTTEIKIGIDAGDHQVTEEYTFDPQTGLLTDQKASKKGNVVLIDLSYEYDRLGSAGDSSSGKKTGHLSKIVDNLNNAKNREYEFDALGRLTKAKGGIAAGAGSGSANWTQEYAYDRFGNRTSVTATGTAADSSAIPLDGIPSLAYDSSTNRITTSGFEYDAAGNQTRGLAANGTDWLLYEYDAANRLQIIKQDGGTPTNIQAFQYGSTNARLMDLDYGYGYLKIFASIGGTTHAEYTEFAGTVPTWTKGYTYLGSSQLGTINPDGSGGEYVDFNHPDRLGTKLQTNQTLGSSYEQNTLPFGTALNAESSLATNNKRFTSYDRSNATGLDYAVNRTYDSKQGRFTQVDPIGASAASLTSPQTLNMYTYCGNDPVNYVDPSGLFFGKLFRWIGKIFRAVVEVLKWVVIAVVVITVAIAIFKSGGAASVFLSKILGLVGKIIGLKMTTAPMVYSLGTGALTGGTTISLGLSGKLIGAFMTVGAIANFASTDPPIEEDPNVITVETRCSKNIEIGSEHCPIPWYARLAKWARNSTGGMMDSMSLGLYSTANNAIVGFFGQDHLKIDPNSDGYFHGQIIHGAATLAAPGSVGVNGAKAAITSRGLIRSGGLLNSNRYIRIGYGRKGGGKVFRIAIGGKGRLHKHIDLWKVK